MKNRTTRNYLMAAHFLGPEWIPCSVSLLPATWRRNREELEKIVLEHPQLFPGYTRGGMDFDSPGDRRYRVGSFTDNWDCTWRNIALGLDGMVVEHPLEDWADFEAYSPPDPLAEGDGWGERPPDWEALRTRCARAKAAGNMAWGNLNHGFMFMRLYYLRGFENLMLDFATGERRLPELIQMVLDYNMRQIEKCLKCGVEIMSWGDDMGMQASLPISPAAWRRHLGPCYRRMLDVCRQGGVDVYLHSDGHILEIIPDLIDAGVTIINPQVRANGLAGLVACAKGRVCVRLDLDRQLFPFATPAQVREHVRQAVAALGDPRGGLMLDAECGPDVPLENISAICTALEGLMEGASHD
jgi:hypothetical protein